MIEDDGPGQQQWGPADELAERTLKGREDGRSEPSFASAASPGYLEGVKETVRQVLAENERLRSRVRELEAVQGAKHTSMPKGHGNWPRSPARKDVRDSVRYRVGDILVQAISPPGRNTIVAPVRLWRLFREGLRNRRARRRRGKQGA